MKKKHRSLIYSIKEIQKSQREREKEIKRDLDRYFNIERVGGQTSKLVGCLLGRQEDR